MQKQLQNIIFCFRLQKTNKSRNKKLKAEEYFDIVKTQNHIFKFCFELKHGSLITYHRNVRTQAYIHPDSIIQIKKIYVDKD